MYLHEIKVDGVKFIQDTLGVEGRLTTSVAEISYSVNGVEQNRKLYFVKGISILLGFCETTVCSYFKKIPGIKLNKLLYSNETELIERMKKIPSTSNYEKILAYLKSEKEKHDARYDLTLDVWQKFLTYSVLKRFGAIKCNTTNKTISQKKEPTEIDFCMEYYKCLNKEKDLRTQLENIMKRESELRDSLCAIAQEKTRLKGLMGFEDSTLIKAELENTKGRLSQVEAENKELKNKIGEGETYRTANNFPNKDKYFKRSYDLNKAISRALKAISLKMNLYVKTTHEGNFDVKVYHIAAHNKLREMIENYVRDDISDFYFSYLKSEYQAKPITFCSPQETKFANKIPNIQV